MNSQTNSENRIAVGGRMQAAREQRSLTLQQASQALRVPARTLALIESGDWDALGAPVFVRGQLRSYARLLALDADDLLEQGAAEAVRPVELVSHDHTPGWERFLNQLGSRLVYVVMTFAIAIPVYMVATRSLLPGGGESVERADLSPRVALHREPVTASLASLPKPAPAAVGLEFEFDGQSWVQFYAPDGASIEKGLMEAGDSRRFAPGSLGRVVVGNASQVRILHDGREVDTSPWRKSNVARFAVSSDGSPLAPE